MSPLQILHEQISANTIMITVIGQMDESNIDIKAPEIYKAIESIPNEGNLILNFSGLEYMNSKSIGYTTDFFNKMTEKKGKMIVAESQPQIVDILNVVGLTQIITFVNTIDEAKKMLEESPETNITKREEKKDENNEFQISNNNIEEYETTNQEIIEINTTKKENSIQPEQPEEENNSNEFILEDETSPKINKYKEEDEKIPNTEVINAKIKKDELIHEEKTDQQTNTKINPINSQETELEEKDFPILITAIVISFIIIMLVIIL